LGQGRGGEGYGTQEFAAGGHEFLT
jgi:hypothetical protein